MFLRNPMTFWAAEITEHHTVLFSIAEVCTSILHIVPPSYRQQLKLQELACFIETVGGNGIMTIGVANENQERESNTGSQIGQWEWLTMKTETIAREEECST